MKKTLAILLSLALVICMIPGTAFAAGGQSTTLKVALSANSSVYDGTVKVPKVTVTKEADPATTLTENTDYTVAWSGEIKNVGTYTVTVTGKEGTTYAGETGTATYDVTAKTVEAVTVTVAEATYNGAVQTPTITVKAGTTVIPESDYTVTWTKGKVSVTANQLKEAGEYTATVKLNGNYTGTTTGTGTFKINQLDLSASGVSIVDKTPITSADIGSGGTGTVTNKIAVKFDGKEITTGFTATAADQKNGTVHVTVTANPAQGGNLTDSRVAAFYLKTAFDGTYTAAAPDQTYDGTAKEPAITIKKNGTTVNLKKGTDYTVTFSGNTDAGSASFRVTGIGKYTGTIDGAFIINRRPISSTGITINVPSVEQGEQPVVTVTDGSKTLEKGTDYTYVTPVTTNTGKITLEISGVGNYNGTTTASFNVVATGNEIEAEDITLIGSNGYAVASYTPYYMKAVMKPTLKVNLGGTGVADLREGKDYSVSYKYTVKDSAGKDVVKTTTSPIDAHDYTIVVTGIGAYGGEVELTGKFSILPYPFNTNSVTITVTQGSTTATPNVTVKSIDGRITFVKGTDYTVGTPYTYNGKSTVTITSTNTGNLGAGSLSETYAVSAKNIAYCTADFAIGSKQTYQYTGSIIKPNVTVRDGYTTLVAGTDYTVTYKDAAGKVVYSPKDAGTYQIVIEGKGMYSGTKTLTFYIQGTSIANYTVTLKESVVNATGYAQTPTIVSVKYGANSSLTSSDYTVSYQNAAGTTVTSIKTPGTYKVVVTGKNGYSGSTYATFTVKGLDQTMKIAKTSYKVYEDSDSFKINASVTGDGTIIYTSMNPSVATVSSTGVVTIHKVGRARIVVETINNVKYDPVEDEVFVKVYPDKAKITKKPWTDGKASQLKVRWGYQDGVTKYQVRYSTSKSFSSYKTKTVTAHGKDLATQSTTIKNLKSGKTYYFKVRAVYETYNENGTKITYYGSWSPWRSAKTK